jgi:F420-dependent oxidoreductase-like protein
MRFGMFIPQGWRLDLVGIEPERQWSVMRGLAERADAGDAWESVWVYDHFHTDPGPTEEATHEAWTLMSAFAASTRRVRLGQMCTAVRYRNPPYLAKVAATVDIISGGRVEMGIGAGWYEHEWRAYGYGFPPASERLGRLREAVEIFRQAWTAGSATLDGKYYQVDGAIVRPLPLQDGGIPIWVAGGGEKVTLRIAAQFANYTNFGGEPDVFVRKSLILQQHCAELGTDFDSIVRSVNFTVVVGSSESDLADRLARIDDRLRKHVPAEVADRAMNQLHESAAVGTVERVLENLTALGDLGLGYAICYFPEAAYDLSGIELFERSVLRELR